MAGNQRVSIAWTARRTRIGPVVRAYRPTYRARRASGGPSLLGSSLARSPRMPRSPTTAGGTCGSERTGRQGSGQFDWMPGGDFVGDVVQGARCQPNA